MIHPALPLAAVSFVLALLCYLASNIGAAQRDYRRHKGLMAATGALMGVGLAASILAAVGPR